MSFLPPRRKAAPSRPVRLTIDDVVTRTGRTYDEAFEVVAERAAIREHLGGVPRAEVEQLALRDAIELLGLGGRR